MDLIEQIQNEVIDDDDLDRAERFWAYWIGTYKEESAQDLKYFMKKHIQLVSVQQVPLIKFRKRKNELKDMTCEQKKEYILNKMAAYRVLASELGYGSQGRLCSSEDMLGFDLMLARVKQPLCINGEVKQKEHDIVGGIKKIFNLCIRGNEANH